MRSRRTIDLRFLLFLLPLLIYLPFVGGYLYPVNSEFSDLAISHDPYTYFLQQSIIRNGQIPLWQNSILSGAPFAANPLSGVFYPPGWLALIFSLPLGLNIMALAHLLWGGVGMYLFLRRINLRPATACLGAIAFEALPKLAVHFAAGHLTLIYAVSWTPWVLWAETRRWEGGGRWDGRILPGLLVGMIFLADPRWAVYSGLLWAVYAVWLRMAHPVGLPGIRRSFWQEIGGMALQAMAGGALAAPLLLSMMQYAQLSTRSLMTGADRLAYSLPPARLLGLLFPDIGGYAEWIFYPGALILSLALFGVFAPGIRRRCGLWYGVFIVMVIWAMGDNIPGVEALASLPGLDWLRVPSRGLFLAGFALIVLAVQAVDMFLGDNLENDLEARLDPILYLTGMFGFALLIVGGIRVLSGALTIKFIWGTAALTIAFVWILARRRGWISAQVWWVGALILVLADCGGVSVLNFQPRSTAEVQSEGKEAAQYLSEQPGQFRVYSPSYSLPQQTAVRWGLELADGVDPLQLKSYAQYMTNASGIPAKGYSVTLPAYTNEDVHSANQGFFPDLRLLGRLNVKYVAADFDMNLAGLKLLARFGNTRIYQNAMVMPRAWVEPLDGEGNNLWMPALIESWTPNRIVLKAEGAGLLVLSEMDYSGWVVRIDNAPSEIVPVDGLLRGVKLESGTHLVEFVFRPVIIYVGIGLAVLVMMVWLWLLTTKKGEYRG
ncbi:MAG: hypothetical protein ABFD44_07040 [Anaerolineaceae bacterium]